jgi:hypothetical protein
MGSGLMGAHAAKMMAIAALGFALPPFPPAAPAGTVTAGQLPPPTAPGTTTPGAFPTAPEQTEQEVAALDPSAAEANAPDISAGSVAGVWNASVAGQTCRVATPQTRFGQGFRAGPLRCPAPLDGVKSWNVTGKQLALEGGNVLARLYSTGGEAFSGQTTSGQAISLSR